DLVFVVGQDSGDTYTLNFGRNLTTPITIAASGGKLLANGADGDNFFNKVLGTNGAPNQLSWAPVYGPVPPVETVTFSGTPTQVLVGGSGSNYSLDRGSGTTIDGGPAANTFVITASAGSGVVLNGGPSTNNYVIDLRNLAGPVAIQNSNPGATNRFTVNGAPGNNTITASRNQVTEGTQTITVSTPLTGLTINGGSGNNQIMVSNLSVPVQGLALKGGGGLNSFTLSNVGANVRSLAIIAGSGGPGTNQVQGQSSFTSGNVIVRDVTFTESGDAPTILVTGGSLTLRNCVVQESTG